MKKGLEEYKVPAASGKVTIDQVGCLYRPHPQFGSACALRLTSAHAVPPAVSHAAVFPEKLIWIKNSIKVREYHIIRFQGRLGLAPASAEPGATGPKVLHPRRTRRISGGASNHT